MLVAMQALVNNILDQHYIEDCTVHIKLNTTDLLMQFTNVEIYADKSQLSSTGHVILFVTANVL